MLTYREYCLSVNKRLAINPELLYLYNNVQVIYHELLSTSPFNKTALLAAAFDGGLLIFSSNLLNANFTGMQATVVGPDPEDSGFINLSLWKLLLSCCIIALLPKFCSMAKEDKVLVFVSG